MSEGQKARSVIASAEPKLIAGTDAERVAYRSGFIYGRNYAVEVASQSMDRIERERDRYKQKLEKIIEHCKSLPAGRCRGCLLTALDAMGIDHDKQS